MAVVIGASLDRCFLAGAPAKPLRDRLLFRFSKKLPMSQSATTNRGVSSIRAALITNPDDFQVGRFVGSYGFMNITRFVLKISVIHHFNHLEKLFWSMEAMKHCEFSNCDSYSSFQSGGFQIISSAGFASDEMERLRIQDVGEGQVKIRCLHWNGISLWLCANCTSC